MAESKRPHCQQPDACRAKTEKHCRSCSISASWRDPEIRARRSEACRAAVRAPEERLRRAADLRCRWSDQGFRERVSEGLRLVWSDPGHRERRRLAKQERQPRHGLGLDGWREYRAARREGFDHEDALDIARDAEKQSGAA